MEKAISIKKNKIGAGHYFLELWTTPGGNWTSTTTDMQLIDTWNEYCDDIECKGAEQLAHFVASRNGIEIDTSEMKILE